MYYRVLCLITVKKEETKMYRQNVRKAFKRSFCISVTFYSTFSTFGTVLQRDAFILIKIKKYIRYIRTIYIHVYTRIYIYVYVCVCVYIYVLYF